MQKQKTVNHLRDRLLEKLTNCTPLKCFFSTVLEKSVGLVMVNDLPSGSQCIDCCTSLSSRMAIRRLGTWPVCSCGVRSIVFMVVFVALGEWSSDRF